MMMMVMVSVTVIIEETRTPELQAKIQTPMASSSFFFKDFVEVKSISFTSLN